MRALIQRVSRAAVRFPESPDLPERSIGRGFLILLGCGPGDDETAARRLAAKCAALRVFPDEAGKFARSLTDVSGQALVVSQFTLYADCSGGRRPDFTGALPAAQAEPLYLRFVEHLKAAGVPSLTGDFGAKMEVELVNDGPVTLWLDSKVL